MAWFSGTQAGPADQRDQFGGAWSVAFGDDTADWIGKRVTLGGRSRCAGSTAGPVDSIVVQPLHEPQRGKAARPGKGGAPTPDPLADLDADP